MLFISSLPSTVFFSLLLSVTIKAISNYTREINHRSRMKVIKFVNSTVKCNVNFTDASTWNFSHKCRRQRRRWMCWDCEMNQIISCSTKSNQIWLSLILSIVHSYGNFQNFLSLFSCCHFPSRCFRCCLLKNVERKGVDLRFFMCFFSFWIRHWRYL